MEKDMEKGKNIIMLAYWSLKEYIKMEQKNNQQKLKLFEG